MSERERLLELVGEGGIEFAGVDVLRLRGPVVYLVMRGERPMYVGMSRRGVTRPFNAKHHALAGLGEDDRVQVWPVASVEAAQELEMWLIHARWPVWNRRAFDDTAGIGARLGMSATSVRRMRRARGDGPRVS